MAEKIYMAKEATSQQILAGVNDLKKGAVERPKRYGVRINMLDSNPATRCTYMYDAEGMRPAAMNFSGGGFDYGDWGDIWFIANNRPVMLKNDGAVAYELDHSNHTKKLDGTASDIANTAYAGNAMSEIPLVWVKRYQLLNYRYVIVCAEQYDETYKAYAHTDADGNVCPAIYLPMYEGKSISGKLRSLSGQTVTASQDDATETAQAAANGTGWQKTDFSSWELIRDLLTLISRSTNAQASFGNGCMTADDYLATGTLNGGGQFMGYSSATQAVKVFFIENWWGNYWKRIQGCLLVNGIYYIKATPPYNNTGAGFLNTGLTVTGTSGGYISKMQNVADIGAVPAVVSGSATTYECDGCWFNAAITAVALVGGYRGDGALDGPAFLHVGNAASFVYASIAASVSFKKRLAA